jgi:spermidine synthase
MKQPLLKRILSYVKDVEIESTSSEYNETLDLYLVKDRYQLCTEKAIYSYGDKYDNFAKIFSRLNFDQIQDVLILGFGLASIPYIIEKIHKKFLNYTGVEIDDEVIYLASKYVLDELKSEINVVQADAFSFISIDDKKYDLICMDVFEDDTIPEDLQSYEYLQMLKESLAKNGLLIYNRLSFTDDDKKETDLFFSDVFQKVFPDAYIFDTGGNRMLLNNKIFNQ